MRRLAVLAATAVAACGGDETPRPAAEPQPAPPRAAEPARSPEPTATPAGRVVRVGGPVEGLAADESTGLLAAARQDPPVLALVDLRSGRLGREVSLAAAPRHLEIARPGGPVLVPAEEADRLVEVPLADDGAVRTTPAGDHPHDAAAIGAASFTADEFGSTVTRVERGRRVAQAPVDVQPGGIVAVGGQLAVVSVRAYTLELLDPRTLRGLGSQSAGLGPTHVAADAEDRVWITDTRGDALVAFATQPRLKWLARLPLRGSPYGLAIDARRGRAWVTLTARNELVEIVLGDRPRRGRTFPTVRQPNSVAVDERTGRVAVASAAGDALQLVDP